MNQVCGSAPPGHFRSTVTHLRMRLPPSRELPAPPLDQLALTRWQCPEPDQYLALFRRVGAPWLWYGHLEWPAARLEAFLHADSTEVYRLRYGNGDAGFSVLDRGVPGAVEVVYCGVIPERIGYGLGSFLLRSTLAMAWREEVREVWLHTCSEDHPSALAFYRHLGFEPRHQTVEWVHDPRLRGLLPRTAGPHVPLAE